MNKKVFRWFLFLFLIFLNVFAFSLTVPPRPEARVSDWAGLLSAQARDAIEAKLQNFEESTGNQIAVATFLSLEGESLEAFSIKLAEQWKIGQKGKDNGVILLIFKQEAKIRIEVGYGLEGLLPDAVASQIISRIMAPYFKQGDFDAGVSKALDAMIGVIKQDSSAESVQTSSGGEAGIDLMKLRAVKYFIIGIVGLLGFLFLIDLFRYRSYAVSNGSYKHRYGLMEWIVIFGLTLAFIRMVFTIFLMSGRGGYSSGGRGGGSGGGFSGGGGSFGGGGASGGW